jgi:hypothetical protein
MAAVVLAMWGMAAGAAELPEGTVISKANIDQIKNDTFMGHTIASLLTERREWEIRNWNLKMPLAKLPEPQLDPKYVEATKKYAGQVKYDPQTNEVSGHVAGLPFPAISESDPHAGSKVLWNFYLGSATGKDASYRTNFITVNQNGLESSQRWVFQRLFNKGRLGEDKPVLGDPQVLTKTIFVATAPEDIKGVGTFTIRYDVAGKVEDQWAYIKSARRVRRLSGNAWMDPVGGFDFLNDDIYVFNARPSQYQSLKLIGKRWILAGTETGVARDASKAGTPDEWPSINLKEAPYWQPVQKWTPREVWVVEATPPAQHPYSKKVVYVDTKVPAIYAGEAYDKNGNFWRQINFHYQQKTGQASGIRYFIPFFGNFIDYKAKHSTTFSNEAIVDKDGTKEGYFVPESLEHVKE